jgi:3-oxoacyl-[acyl-carrier protein] reductase
MAPQKFGRIDISINLISISDVQGQPLFDISLSDFMAPIQSAMQTQFITAIASAKMMSVR